MSERGIYTTVDGRPAVRFERRLRHPIEAVWRAITDPSELAHWFPHPISIEALRVGGRVRVTDGSGVAESAILELDPPRRLAFRWGAHLLRFELAPEHEGTTLTITHVLEQEGERAAAKAPPAGTCASTRSPASWPACRTRRVPPAPLRGGERSTTPTSPRACRGARTCRGWRIRAWSTPRPNRVPARGVCKAAAREGAQAGGRSRCRRPSSARARSLSVRRGGMSRMSWPVTSDTAGLGVPGWYRRSRSAASRSASMAGTLGSARRGGNSKEEVCDEQACCRAERRKGSVALPCGSSARSPMSRSAIVALELDETASSSRGSPPERQSARGQMTVSTKMLSATKHATASQPNGVLTKVRGPRSETVIDAVAMSALARPRSSVAVARCCSSARASRYASS